MSSLQYSKPSIADGHEQRGMLFSMSRLNGYISYLLVYLLFFLSGSWRFNLESNHYLILGFFLTCVAWILLSDRRVNSGFLLYLIAFAGFLIALHIYTGGGYTLPSAIASVMKLMIAYLILKTVGSRFADVYIKVIVFLAVISLFGFLTDIFHLFDALVVKLPPVGDMGYEGVLYLFRFPWHMERNNSIFFEPGAYQAFLNSGLFLIFFAKTSFGKRRIWIYTAILLTTLVTTFSTQGFLIFLIMFPVFLYKSKIFSFSNKTLIIGAAAVVVLASSAHFYSAFVVKLDQFFTAAKHQINTSASVRSNDSRTDLKIFKKHIFGVGYEQYNIEFATLDRRPEIDREGGSSNGVTKMLAIMGLPFSVFLFGSYFWALQRLLRNLLLSTLAFCMYMLFLAGEAYYMSSPISFAIIAAAFVFNRYSPEFDAHEVSSTNKS